MNQNIAELISLGLTVPTILLSIWVVRLYWSAAVGALYNENKTSIHWFTIGIAIGFLGSTLDNFYWAIPWSASYLELPATTELINIGVYFNIPFRQLCGMIAAYCHVRSAIAITNACPDSSPSRLHRFVAICLAIGALMAIILMVLKWII